MKKRGKLSVTLVCLLALSLLAACGGNGNNGNNANNADNASSVGSGATETNDGGTGNAGDSGTDTAAVDPLGKYETPVDMSIARPTNSGAKFKEGDSWDSNIWIKAYEELLGIKVKNEWVASGDGAPSPYAQKLNVSIASADLPDVFVADAVQLKQLADNGQLADLTQTFEQYGSPLTKEIFNRDEGVALKSATFGGKLLGIPSLAGGSISGTQMIWLRTDWLEKLGLTPPKTMDDLYKIADAFTNGDPDGNGKKDTFAFGLTKDLYSGAAGVEGFFNSFHAYPTLWIEKDGQLVYGSVQPETKAALAKLQELYKSGQIDREFGVKDGGKVGEAISQNKLGIIFGQQWNNYWPINDGVLKNPGMDWKPYPLVSVDDQPAKPGAPFTVGAYLVVNKDYEHPEAVVKMINLYNEKLWKAEGRSEADIPYNNDTTDPSINTYLYSILPYIPTNADLDALNRNKKIYAAADAASLTSAVEKDLFDRYQKYKQGDPAQWATFRQIGPEDSSYVILEQYVKDFVTSGFYGASTTTMSSKWNTLLKQEKDTFTKIIMGSAPIDEFDKFVETWNKLGGEQVTKEVNEWKAQQ